MEEKTISSAELPNFPLVYKEVWEKIGECIRELSQERDMWKERYEELNKRHLALCDEHYHLSCAHRGFTKVVLTHKIDPKEVLAAIEECEKEAKEAKTVVGIPCPNPDEERDFCEETSDPDDDDYAGWGNTFEQAAQKSSEEDYEKSKLKAEEENKTASITN